MNTDKNICAKSLHNINTPPAPNPASPYPLSSYLLANCWLALNWRRTCAQSLICFQLTTGQLHLPYVSPRDLQLIANHIIQLQPASNTLLKPLRQLV